MDNARKLEVAIKAMRETLDRARSIETSDVWRAHPIDYILAQPDDLAGRRQQMVDTIRDRWTAAGAVFDPHTLERVLDVMNRVPREDFISPDIPQFAYLPCALRIDCEQTISQPQIVAAILVAAELSPTSHVLDIGTGSGYQAALSGLLAQSVVSIEIHAGLAEQAKARLARLNIRNVRIAERDGFDGAPDGAPYDAILVAAGASDIPAPLLDQLGPGGRLIMPVGAARGEERLIVATKTGKAMALTSLGAASFVPLTGRGARVGRGRHDAAMIPYRYGCPVT